MNAIELTCPFCNARIGATATARQTCPRCGESFAANHAIQTEAPAVTNPAITATPPPSVAPRGKPIKANRVVAGVVLVVMGVLAATSLTFALRTVQTRRDHDKELPARVRRASLPPLRKLPAVEPAEPVAPVQLPLLRYLPSGTSVVAGLHAQELLSSAAGRDLGGRAIKLGNFELRLDLIKEMTGVPPEQIDHVVLGLTVRDKGEAEITAPTHLLVRTRSPFDLRVLREKLAAETARAEKTPTGGKRDVYAGKLRGIEFPLTLAALDDRTFAIGLFTRFHDLPEKPADNLDHLGAEVRQALEQRLAVGMPLWVAGHAGDWNKTMIPTLLGLFPNLPLVDQLGQVKTFAIGVVPDRPLKVQGAFRAVNEGAAKKLEAEQLAPRSKKEPATFRHSRDGEWLDVQWKITG